MTIPGFLLYIDDLGMFPEKDEDGDTILSNEELGYIVRQLAKYIEKGEEAQGLSPVGKVAFRRFKANAEKGFAKYVSCVENGKKGGRPKNPEKPRETHGNPEKPTETQKNQIVKEKENIKENIKDNTKERVSIDKTDTPTLNDVRNYVREKGLKIDPERFFLYYQSRGWRIKGDIIFDWKALVESWEKGEGQIIPINGIKKKILPAQDFQQRDYTEEEMERNSNSVLNSLIKEKEAAN